MQPAQGARARVTPTRRDAMPKTVVALNTAEGVPCQRRKALSSIGRKRGEQTVGQVEERSVTDIVGALVQYAHPLQGGIDV
jgi:hypothetical protein